MGYLRMINALNPYYNIGNYKYRIFNEHIEFIRGDYWFVVNNGYIGMSIDNGDSIKNKIQFEDYQKIEFSHIFHNGVLVFATQNKVYKSLDFCHEISEVPVKYLDGRNYAPVSDSTNFRNISTYKTQIINGKETLLFGNYTNYGFADTDVNVYMIDEDVSQLSILYTFGYNEDYPDAPGDVNIPTICKHIHSISYDKFTDSYWLCTGDGVNECHWINISLIDGQWIFTVLKSGSDGSHFKIGTLFFDIDNIYWNKDIAIENSELNGVYKVDRLHFDNLDYYDRIHESGHPSLPGYQDNNIIVYGYTFQKGIPNTLVLTKDMFLNTEEIIFDGIFDKDVSFLRPRIDNNIIRIDAKPIDKISSYYTYYVQTILLDIS